jgi:hypothetical protein
MEESERCKVSEHHKNNRWLMQQGVWEQSSTKTTFHQRVIRRNKSRKLRQDFNYYFYRMLKELTKEMIDKDSE